MNPFLVALADIVAKTADEFLKTYLAREDIRQVEKDEAIIRQKDFVIASQAWLIRAMLSPSDYSRMRDLGQAVQFPVSPDTRGPASGGIMPGDPGG